jgi:hypothetical protein
VTQTLQTVAPAFKEHPGTVVDTQEKSLLTRKMPGHPGLSDLSALIKSMMIERICATGRPFKALRDMLARGIGHGRMTQITSYFRLQGLEEGE